MSTRYTARTILLVLMFGFSSNVAAQQEDCNEILRLGLYDHFRDLGVEARASQMENELCSTYERVRESRKKGEIAVEYKLFDGKASFSYEELESAAGGMCDRRFSAAEAQRTYDRSRRILRSESIAAWDACKAADNSGITRHLTISDDPAGAVVIEIRRRLQPGTTDRELRVLGVDINPAESFTCKGTLRLGATIPNGSPGTLSCTRSIFDKPLQIAGRRYWARSATITVTTAHGAVTVPFAGLPVATPPAPIDLPIGSVVAFAGPPAKIPRGWLHCNGQAVNRTKFDELFRAIGTSHGAGDGVTTFLLPDYRGRFLRGADLGAGRDPDRNQRVAPSEGANGGDKVGSVQDDAFRSHEHPLNIPHLGHTVNGNGSVRRVDMDDGPSFDNIDIEIRAQPVGSTETRPTNAYVIYMIRAK